MGAVVAMATPSVPRGAVPGQVNSASQRDDAQGKDHSLVLALLRDAIDECGWKHEALAAAMQLSNPAYLSRMLSGEKPWTLRHLLALPDDIEARFTQKWAAYLGAIVVAPLHGVAAVEALVSGLVGVLAPQLPMRATHMAKADGNRGTTQKAVRR